MPVTPIRPPQKFNQTFLSDYNSRYKPGNPKIILFNDDVISGEIYSVLNTSPALDANTGERIFEPTFGSNLYDLIFDPIDAKSAFLISNAVHSALIIWVPHLQIFPNDVDVFPNLDVLGYDVKVFWRIRANNLKGNTGLRISR